jgi:hypothetical protein
VTNFLKINCLVVAGFCLLGSSIQSEEINLINPSFEDVPQAGIPPYMWTDMGFEGETPPDVQPGFFGCKKKAYDGDTYLGLVTRDNETYEAVGQMFQNGAFIQVLAEYKFSLYLARSKQFESISKTINQKVNFDAPVKLRIWALDRTGKRSELLDETDTIMEYDWFEYSFVLLPRKADYYGIVLEVYWEDETQIFKNGHLLIDHCSSIQLMQ